MMAMSRLIVSPVHANRTGPYSEDAGSDGLCINAFNHDDVDVAFGGPTRDSIDVMIPDCLLPPVGGDIRVDLRHLVTLSLGQAMDMSNCVPAPNLDRALLPQLSGPHPRSTAPGVLGRGQPITSQVEECQRHSLSGMHATDRRQYGPSSATGTFDLCLFLAVPGSQLLTVVHLGTERQGPHREHSPIS